MVAAESPDPIDIELIRIVTDLLGVTRAVSRDTDLVNDLAIESVQMMELLLKIEDRYDLVIDIDTLSEIRTLGDLAALVRSRR